MVNLSLESGPKCAAVPRVKGITTAAAEIAVHGDSREDAYGVTIGRGKSPAPGVFGWHCWHHKWSSNDSAVRNDPLGAGR